MEAATIANVAAKSFQQIPRIKPSLPILGTTWQYLRGLGRYSLDKLHEANEDKYHRYGSIVKEEFVPGEPVIHLYDPNDFQTVFRSQGKYPNRPPSDFIRHYRLSRPDRYSTIGMAHSQGEEWLIERLKLAPLLLKSTFIENNLPVQNEICNHFIKYISSTGSVSEKDQVKQITINNLKESTDRLALESIVNLSLGIQIGCLNDVSSSSSSNESSSYSAEMLISTTQQLFEAYNKLYYGPKLWKLMSTSAYKAFTSAEDNIYDLASSIMKEQINKSTGYTNINDDNNYTSIVDYLFSQTESTDVSSAAVTVADFIAGGTFTVSTSLVYALYHLSHNEQVQEKLYSQIQSITSSSQRSNQCDQITMDHLSQMNYLKACVKESFRLTPTTPAVVRVLQEDAVLSGYHVPKGLTVFSHFLVTCRLDKYFDDPLVYKPDRWMNKENKASNNPFALLPFGFGNRMCIGRRFSEIQLYLALAKVVSKFKVEPITQSLDLTHAFIVVPSHKVSIRLIPRH